MDGKSASLTLCMGLKFCAAVLSLSQIAELTSPGNDLPEPESSLVEKPPRTPTKPKSELEFLRHNRPTAMK